MAQFFTKDFFALPISEQHPARRTRMHQDQPVRKCGSKVGWLL